ncbi:universal stress protein [Sinomicrobium kalidii]|uniref:universal stress protein n=1 Tax=Sinomicrobium kalidii TaxID=2900738 RepID=UPI001E470B51|nr:universal stress protein [Sinomicrobium kalidii]UGU14696.1 universal stress protein [Sinomicrobium kalidii]
MKQILLPTDFSENSLRAIRYATAMFRDEKCTFHLLHVFEVPYYPIILMSTDRLHDPAYEIALERSQNALRDITLRMEPAKNSNHHVEIISRKDTLLHAVKLLVKERNIDMIIMGSKGARNARGINYGSNAVTLMEKISSCPVMAIPRKARFRGFNEIVFPSSFEIAYEKKEINPLLELAGKFGASIRVIHIGDQEELTETQKKNRKLLEGHFGGLNCTFHSLSDIPPAAGISCFAESRDTDLIALVNRKHSFFYRLTEKPVIKGISFYSRLPVMVMHI